MNLLDKLQQHAPHLQQHAPHLQQHAPHLQQHAPHLQQHAPHLQQHSPLYLVLMNNRLTKLNKLTNEPSKQT